MNKNYAKRSVYPDKSSENAASALIACLNYFYPLNAGIEEFLKKHTYPVFFSKGKLLLKAGQVCEHVYFIQYGAVRGFIKEGKKDITTWITAENELVTSISSLDNVDTALENMQATEDCYLLALNYADIRILYTKFPEFNIVSRKLLQQYYRDAEGRAYIARLRNAENKYKYFLKNHSRLANRIPLKYIASFLGVTLETLSRVRKKISSGSEKI
ncbi:MAG TPA: Crp/Fnr family transcriptional regulator [Chitinophagaceae bacterium]|nr:Crp/Fnr family transcriptional regulator [Chitinophagaceae bacterium]